MSQPQPLLCPLSHPFCLLHSSDCEFPLVGSFHSGQILLNAQEIDVIPATIDGLSKVTNR